MGQYAYRLTIDEATSLRQGFSWVGFYIERVIQFVMSILFLYGIVLWAYRIFTLPFRVLLAGRRVQAFIKEITVNPRVGASWFWWTYVTFVVGKKEKTFKLTPGQAVKLVIRDQIREADAGKLSYFGRRMIAWRPTQRPEDTVPQVFLSYSQDRSGEAELVANILKGRGLRVWRDKEKLVAGDSLPKEIESSILSSQAFLPLLSTEYIASKWCQNELQLACERIPKGVLPIKITPEKLFIPSFVQDSLEKAGEPLFLDLNNKDSLEELRAIGDRILRGELPQSSEES